MSIQEFASTLNKWGSQKIPFLFIVDFELQKPLAFKLSDVDAATIQYDVRGVTNARRTASKSSSPVSIQKFPITQADFQPKFETVMRHLSLGDSYLTNLTIRTEIKLSHSLGDLFNASRAKYKLLFQNDFLVFSPETFITIKDGFVFSYPMKGTIDASIPSAADKILTDRKELAEHVTIVDLIRNDLSRVASQVEVSRFRYVEEVQTNTKPLLQVSSEIRGKLSSSGEAYLGDILVSLLPAGSVSGAPKDKTIEIIRNAEAGARGYYTGIFGLFDGHMLDSGVMIRFIEREGEKFFYRSGGGITTQSVLENEYQEAIDKVYVPAY
jgi:para-aminobenzoate synthetase component I